MRKVGYFKDRIPVSCHIFNNKGLSLEPSDELKEKFENYFHMINCIVEKVSKDDMNEIDTEKLKQDYILIVVSIVLVSRLIVFFVLSKSSIRSGIFAISLIKRF